MLKSLFRFLFMQKDLHDLTELSNDFNLKRIAYVSVIIFVYQIFNLTDLTHSLERISISVTILSLICLSYFLVIVLYYRNFLDAGLGLRMSISFWIMILFGMTQYFIMDIYTVGMPINILTYCALLVIIPIFSTQQSFWLFAIFLVYSTLLATVSGASAHYIQLNALICTSGFVVSMLIQQQYVRMILSLLRENRIDALTGILNRRGGLDRIETLLALCKRHGRTIAIFMIDIDYFKPFNDRLGHLEGDNALRRVARALDGVFERRSDIVCRYGGEEFLAGCSIQRESDAALLAERLCDSVAAMAIPTPDPRVCEHLTVSIGYTVYTSPQTKEQDAIDITHFSLIMEADKALYRAKEQGRNRCVDYST